MAPTHINAVIFDMDGLLLDSESLYSKVTNEVCAPYGVKMTWDIKAGIMGRPAPDAARYLIEKTGLPLTPDELLSRMELKLEEEFRSVKILPGVEKFVNHLVKHNIPMAIATGSKTRNFEIKSSHLGHLFDPFKGKVLCGDDPILQGKGKPDPTIFIVCAERHLGITTPEERAKILVFEDGAPGVRAARAAGMEVVWIPDPELVATMGDHDLNPSHQHTTMSEFVPEQWGLPPYDK